MPSCSAVPAIEPTIELLSVMGKEQITRVMVGSAASLLSSITTCELKTSVLNSVMIVKDVWDYGLKLRAAMQQPLQVVEILILILLYICISFKL